MGSAADWLASTGNSIDATDSPDNHFSEWKFDLTFASDFNTVESGTEVCLSIKTVYLPPFRLGSMSMESK